MPPVCCQAECPTPQDCANEGRCYIARVALIPVKGRTQERCEKTPPTRVGIAIVDHEDNVLENGPYFNVQRDEVMTNELETLVRPMLARYAERAGILSHEEAVAARRPQGASNASLRKPIYAVGDVVVLRGHAEREEDGEALPRIAEIKSVVLHSANEQWVTGYLVEEYEGIGLSETQKVKMFEVARLATGKEVLSAFLVEDQDDDHDFLAEDLNDHPRR